MVGGIAVSVGTLRVAGMGAREAARLRAGFAARLEALLSERGVPGHWAEGVPPLRLAAREAGRPERLGAALAEAMFEVRRG
jgi:hypothetical protein